MDPSDRELWRRFAANVRPLTGHIVANAPPSAGAPPRNQHTPRVSSRTLAPLAVGVPPPGLDRSSWLRLRRGRTAPERRLDLHGFRVEAAFVAVEGFIVESASAGVRVVEVVTGRGLGAEGGVIRRTLPDWLNGPALRPFVLAVCHPRSLNPGAANAGAVLLLLRRSGSERHRGRR